MKSSYFTFVGFLQCAIIHLVLVNLTHGFGFTEHQCTLVVCKNSTYDLENIVKRFKSAGQALGYSFEVIDNDCDLNTTLKYFNHSNVVVNYDVYYYGQSNDYIMHYLHNLTDIIIDQYGEMNKSLSNINCTYEVGQNHSIRDPYERSCKDPFFNKYTKLFLGSLQTHQTLYNVFDSIMKKENEDKKYKPEVLVCSDDSLWSWDEFDITRTSCNEEFKCRPDTVAVIASSPESIATSCDENIPVIFYETLYIEPSTEALYTEASITDYKSSTNVYHWKSLSSALLTKVLSNYWERYGIITDDHPISKKFKNDQIDHFKRTNNPYATRDCSGQDDFKEALLFFKDTEAKIIIVNVGKQNLRIFKDSAIATDMAKRDILWIFSDYKMEDLEPFTYVCVANLQNGMARALNLIKDEYHKVLGNKELFRNAIRHYKPSVVDSSKVECSQNARYITGLVLPSCSMRTGDFYNPCNDWNILYIILVILVFLLLIFGTIVFFDRIQQNTLAYKPLHKQPPIWRQIFKGKPAESRQGYEMECRQRF